MSAWILIILTSGYHGKTVTVIPFQTQAACANALREMSGTFVDQTKICVPTGAK